ALRRAGGVSRADRGTSYGDRTWRFRGGDCVFRSAGGRRSWPPVQKRRQRNRRALRHHAELHGEMERAISGLLRSLSPVALRRQEESFLRSEGPPCDEQAVRELSRRTIEAPPRDRADVLADSEQLQTIGRWLLGTGQADVGRRQPHSELSRAGGIAQINASRNAQ